jgi:tetratricopeptide (TPR) repeat protein
MNIKLTRTLLLVGCFLFSFHSLTLADENPDLERAIQLFEQEQHKDALDILEKLVEQEPNNPIVALYLGRIALREQRHDEAIGWLEKATELGERTSNSQLWLGHAYLGKLQTVSFFEKGPLSGKVRACFETSVELDSENVSARVALASYFLSAPPIAGGSKEKAQKQVEEIKKRDPRQGQLLQARIYMRDGEHELAEKELLAAAELEPQDVGVFYQLGMLYQEAKLYDKAFESFENCLSIDEDCMSAAYQIGRTSVLSGRNSDRGIECLKSYLQSEPVPGAPSWSHAHWRLGMLYEKNEEGDLARAEYELAIELDPDNESAMQALKNLAADSVAVSPD